MFRYFYLLDNNWNSTVTWGVILEHTDQPDVPRTLFEVHGLELENHAKSRTLDHLFSPQVLDNLRQNHNSGLLIQSSTEYTRVGEEPYSTAYAWLRAHGVPLHNIHVLTCSNHLAQPARKTWPEINFSVLDWWEYSPRWWYQDQTPDAPAQYRFTCLNRRPHEWRAAATQYLRNIPEYWNNSIHTIGDRNYHHTDDAPQDQDDYRNLGKGSGYFDDDVEAMAQTWYSTGSPIQLPDTPNITDIPLYNVSRAGAINIITESYPNQTRHSPTEKTYRAYAVGRPHISLAHANWQINLQARGYLPYPWDAEYDGIRDPSKRFRTVMGLIERMAKLSNSEFDEVCRSVQHIVDHNQANWYRRTERKFLHKQLHPALRPQT